MLTLNRFWLLATLFIVAVFLVVAVAIWQTRPIVTELAPRTEPASRIEVPANITKPADNPRAIPAEPDPSYPAPAKKLHKLVTEDDTGQLTQPAFNQRMMALDKQLQTLNDQLQAQGVVLPENKTTDERCANSTSKGFAVR